MKIKQRQQDDAIARRKMNEREVTFLPEKPIHADVTELNDYVTRGAVMVNVNDEWNAAVHESVDADDVDYYVHVQFETDEPAEGEMEVTLNQ